jgi:hypothetical protein
MRVRIRLRHMPTMMPMILRLMFRLGLGYRRMLFGGLLRSRRLLGLRARRRSGLRMTGRQRALAFAETEGLRGLGVRADR